MADGQAGQKRQAEVQTVTADQIKEVAKKWSQLVAQARADKTLKQRLVEKPVAVLQEHGIKVRQGLDIRVVEDTDKVVYLKLPAHSELTDRDLEGVVGGGVTITGTTALAAHHAITASFAILGAAYPGGPEYPSYPGEFLQ